MLRLIWLLSIWVLVFTSTSCEETPHDDELIKAVHKDNRMFEVRIKAYRQNVITFGHAGVDYLVESRSIDHKNWKNRKPWRKIGVVSHDDGIEFGEANIQFPTPSIAFVFISQKYFVTFDEGKNWKRMELMELEESSCRIDNVKIESDGKGEMTLSCSDLRKKFTQDYGVQWSKDRE